MKIYLFYNGPLSQWAHSQFSFAGMTFNTAEQWMMYQKALLFGDSETAVQIIQAHRPGDQKALGRKVRNFSEEVWNERARRVVYLGNVLKFTQNPESLQALLSTGSALLAEASPYDRIWGIGLSASDPAAQTPEYWKGTNWLGQVLMEVRKLFQTCSVGNNSHA